MERTKKKKLNCPSNPTVMSEFRRKPVIVSTPTWRRDKAYVSSNDQIGHGIDLIKINIHILLDLVF